jgi:hypothetical protein
VFSINLTVPFLLPDLSLFFSVYPPLTKMSHNYAEYVAARNAANNAATEPPETSGASNTTQPFTANVLGFVALKE